MSTFLPLRTHSLVMPEIIYFSVWTFPELDYDHYHDYKHDFDYKYAHSNDHYQMKSWCI